MTLPRSPLHQYDTKLLLLATSQIVAAGGGRMTGYCALIMIYKLAVIITMDVYP